MPALATPKDEAFCQGVASGLPKAEAWRRATGRTNNADVHCDQLMGKRGITERITELKEANSRKATLTREQIIEFLCKAVTASASNVEADSSLVQSAEFIDGKPVKLKIPDKIAAVRELVRICGWAQPARLELSARDTLGDFINSIREAGGPRQLAEMESRGVRRPYTEDNGESAHAPLQATQSVVL
jgi:hypothetical protein